MAKKIRDTSKTQPKVDARKLAKDIGAKNITDPEERKEFEKRYGLPSVFVPTLKDRPKIKRPKKLLDNVEYKKLKQLFLKKAKDGVVPPSIVRQYLSFIEKTAQNSKTYKNLIT